MIPTAMLTKRAGEDRAMRRRAVASGGDAPWGLWAVRLLAGLNVVLALAIPAGAQDETTEEGCPDADDPPTPTAVAVTAVPIVVPSTTDDYFVLYVSHEVDDTTVEIPVLVKLGEAETTTLAENIAALPKERYRVEKYVVADPADVDGDCIDDLTELANLGRQNPVNPAAEIDSSDGAVAVADQDTFRMPYKFVLLGLDTDSPSVYFANTDTHRHHNIFLSAMGIDLAQPGIRTGSIFYSSRLVAPDGSRGSYYYPLRTPRRLVDFAHTVLAASLPFLENNLALYVSNGLLPYIQSDLPLYRALRAPLVFDADLFGDTAFLDLNTGVGYGRLRKMEPDERPHPRDIVLYEALPNELPRVAGVISTAPQTPLSHVNLRAIQDGIPNAYIRDAHDDPALTALLDRYVRYEVTADNYTLQAATQAEVEAHYAASRPTQPQTPQRDLTVTAITRLSDIGFTDWTAFGVKAANVAELGTLDFTAGTVPEGGSVPIGGTVPDGFAIPFSFYDRFMRETALGQETVLGKRSGPDDEKITLTAETTLAAAVTAMLAHPVFQTDFDVQEEMLDDLRDAIKDAATPQWIIDALTEMHGQFPEGQSLRYRSSTNNEDLPGFNGAGLYDSYTQHPAETEEEGIGKSLKQVFASLWTFRAFSERTFHRIDHTATAMGVLVHPNYTDEQVNGVAVSFDPTTGGTDLYYINSQVGEDLVTNPEAHSVPEELVYWTVNGWSSVLATSNQVEPGQLLMTDAQMSQLGRHLTTIHDHFKKLYTPGPDEPFAMEIEFKITAENVLAIKQARPWVFEPPRHTASAGGGSNTGSSGGGSGGGGSGGGGSGGGGSRDQHGNTAAQATVISLSASAPWGSSTAGQINTRQDVDYFQLTAPQAGVLVVETTGSTDTVGTVWQDDVELASADGGGVRRNFRLTVRVEAGPVVIAVAGNRNRTGSYTLQTTLLAGYLENPGVDSFQSGIGVLSGWVCGAEEVEIAIGDFPPQSAAYGTERLDTESVCGEDKNIC